MRIRPRPPHHEAEIEDPYLQIVDNYEVSMTPPENSNAYRTRNRAPERYKFTKIFTESVTQQDFFNNSTLPLVKDVLRGENALVFAYGVTNSGKTYSVMGTKEDPGLLPRTLDVIFNSIEGFVSDSMLKPTMHSLVQSYEDVSAENRDILNNAGPCESPHPGSSNPNLWEQFRIPTTRDNTVIDVDQKFEYGIWVSFAEIYTEKIYDLLVPPDKQLKRKPLSLKYEFRSGHKYIYGLKEVKVKSTEEAYGVLFKGQRNRAVFSTLMNHTSSRSHSIFTIRIVRVPIDEEDYIIEDPSYATVSKMSIVDLAGSERHRNTFNSGQRLKEAGNINKSLMVLGQCMETLRLNQLKADMGKRQAVVPFRHSKLTELFKSSFEGDGKAVMVVNVNPFDTGFDENSHVMKFAAVAKDVATWRRIHPKLDLKGITGIAKRLRTSSKDKLGSLLDIEGQSSEELFAAPITDDDEEDDGDTDDPFVDHLIHQLEDLRDKWVDAETRCANMESSVRQQVTQEMEVELRKMEDIYMSALKRENDLNQANILGRLKHSETSSGEDNTDDRFLSSLHDRQQALTVEMNKLRAIVQDHNTTKQSLLEKISELEKDKRKEQEDVRRLTQDLKERDKKIKELSIRPVESSDNMEDDNPFLEGNTPRSYSQKSSESRSMMDVDYDERPMENRRLDEKKFDRFLELRKQLRRSIFRGEEYSQDADIIMTEIEQFEGVTFELVKETNMGRVLKLITQRTFTNDPCHIQRRAKQLFKKFAQLSIPVLARAKPNHSESAKTVLLSVDAGKEEELISDMREALDSLQEENMQLKNRVKFMQEGHRRLKEAFAKTRDVEADPWLSETATKKDVDPANSDGKISAADGEDTEERRESAMFSPVLEVPISTMLPSDDDDDIQAFFCREERPKRRRKLRARQ
ncbi:hypothetical protein DFQ29_002276 [Apophysomyces sp. BC1021]|nr:hypothetical protein DFQ29_002276 [Apophysomyces sp. BC1021]